MQHRSREECAAALAAEEAREPASAFDTLPAYEQDALRLWILLALEAAPTFSARVRTRGHTYALKLDAERALHFYVANASMKGALRAAGFAYETIRGDSCWVFRVRYRCPHHQGDPHNACSQQHEFSGCYGHWPTLCQATEAERFALWQLIACVFVHANRNLRK